MMVVIVFVGTVQWWNDYDIDSNNDRDYVSYDRVSDKNPENDYDDLTADLEVYDSEDGDIC